MRSVDQPGAVAKTENPVAAQQNRARAYALKTQGSAAVKVDAGEDEWIDF